MDAWNKSSQSQKKKKLNDPKDNRINHDGILISEEIQNYLSDESTYEVEDTTVDTANVGVDGDKQVSMEKMLRTNTSNLLQWWKTNKNKYPVLSTMARDYLAICASAVPCEQAHSSGRRTVRWDRCKLSYENIQEIERFKSYTSNFDISDMFRD